MLDTNRQMSEARNNEREQLLMAYFDGELAGEERQQVEALIAANPAYASLIDQWREQGDALRSLPKFSLDRGFADRVMTAMNQRDAIPRSKSASTAQPIPAKTHWQAGAAAIATLAAMLFLTLFVFPAGRQPAPTVATKDSQADSELDAVNSAGPVGQPDLATNKQSRSADSENSGELVRADLGPTRPLLNKSLDGHAVANAKDLVPPMLVPIDADSVEQVLWVDMKSHPTAIADIETVLLENSVAIVRDQPVKKNELINRTEGTQNRLIQRSNSRFEALHVFATRRQVKQAIEALTDHHEAVIQAISLPRRTVVGDSANELLSARGRDSMPDGRVPRLSRLDNRSAISTPPAASATVQQLHPQELVSEKKPSADSQEVRELDEWFGLADKQDESRFIRLLLLVDTSDQEATGNGSTPGPGKQ